MSDKKFYYICALTLAIATFVIDKEPIPLITGIATIFLLILALGSPDE